ncbi:hypothetical protein, partial [Klebsiella pneumoniae]|uniref:hypothetical protein n=1 Tax=Klebsiella pneumoniae TaxID=573 RepID=UPI003EE27A21
MTTATMDAAAPPPSAPSRSIYAVSGWRKTLICFVFLILLPFFASLPAMMVMRISRGLIVDTLGLAIL